MKANGIKYPHGATNPRILNGVPILKGSRIAGRTIAGYSQLVRALDEILQSLPHRTPAQRHAALTCYFDHQKEIDRDLKHSSDADYWRKQVRQREPVAA